jgi:hypothetical protein
MRQVDAAELAAIRGQSAPEPRDPIAVVSGMPRQPCSTAKPRRLFVLSKLLCIPTRLLLFAIGAGLCISLAYGFRYGQRFSAETQTGGLSIDERALDLGSVVNATNFSH